MTWPKSRSAGHCPLQRLQGRIWASGPLGLWPHYPHRHFSVHLSCSAYIHDLLGLWGDIFVGDSFSFQSSKLSFSLLVNIVILFSFPTPLPSLPLLFLPLSFSLLHHPPPPPAPCLPNTHNFSSWSNHSPSFGSPTGSIKNRQDPPAL